MQTYLSLIGASAVLVAFSLLSTSQAFTPSSSPSRVIVITPTRSFIRHVTTTQRCMFGGSGGKSLALEEDDEDEDGSSSTPKGDGLNADQRKQMEMMAKAMGMTVDEYMLGMNARMRMEQDISNLRVVGGESTKGVTVERDGNSPPKFLKVILTEEGKSKLGRVGVEKEVVAALKSAGEKSKKGREQAQQKMMQFIAEQMKTMGKA